MGARSQTKGDTSAHPIGLSWPQWKVMRMIELLRRQMRPSKWPFKWPSKWRGTFLALLHIVDMLCFERVSFIIFSVAAQHIIPLAS